MQHYLKVEDAASLVGVGREAIDDACRRWVATGGREGLAWSSIGKGRVIRAAAIDEWLQRCELDAAGVSARSPRRAPFLTQVQAADYAVGARISRSMRHE